MFIKLHVFTYKYEHRKTPSIYTKMLGIRLVFLLTFFQNFLQISLTEGYSYFLYWNTFKYNKNQDLITSKNPCVSHFFWRSALTAAWLSLRSCHVLFFFIKIHWLIPSSLCHQEVQSQHFSSIVQLTPYSLTVSILISSYSNFHFLTSF